MKKCPNCGNIIENDNAKFCRKCGAKQPEAAVKEQPVEKMTGVNDGILLGGPSRTSTNEDGGQSLSGQRTPQNPVVNSFSSYVDKSDQKNLSWAVRTCFSKYATFNGRASRSEYWYFCLFNCLISIILFGLALIINQETFSLLFLGITFLYMIVVFLPALSVTVRRLHDIGKTGWLYCLNFIPYVGAFILLFFLCKKGDDGENAYGEPN